ncbi:hypothetical protein D3C79_1100880 [compost metagenome]
MLAVAQAHPVLLEQYLLVHPATQPGHKANGQVGLARLQGTFAIAVDARCLQANAWGMVAQVVENTG